MVERDTEMASMNGEMLKGFIRNGEKALAGCGEDFRSYRKSLHALLDRLTEERYHLAVLGQFKRGKSTFLNALLGEHILPSSVVPLTAIPTFIRPSKERGVKVTFIGGMAEEHPASSTEEIIALLEEYVTEGKNPKNVLKVAQVDVYLDSPVLGKGVVLIDTPGIGSTYKHNTEVTLNFLAECDAALFMVSADPPVTEVEVEFLKEVKKKVSRLFFVLNKIDYLGDGEREKVVEFFKSVLTGQAGFEEDVTVFTISAKEGLSGREKGNSALWEKSKVGEVESFLIDFLAREKSRALAEAISKKVSDVFVDALMRVRLVLKSFAIPIKDLEERISLFNGKMEEISRQKQIFDDLLQGDRKRSVEYLEAQAEELRGRGRDYLMDVVEGALLAAEDEGNPEKVVREAIAASIPGFFERVLGEMSRNIDRKIGEVLTPHEKRADELIGTIRKTAAELFDIPYQPLEGASKLVVTREPYWITHKWSSSLSFVPEGSMDRFLPAGVRKARVKKRMVKHIDGLVLHNVENLRWVTLQNLDQTFRKFTSALKERMEETLRSTVGAIEAAKKKREEHEASVEEEQRRFQKALVTLEEISEKISVVSIGSSS